MACHPELAHQVLMDPRTFDKGGPLYDRLRQLMGEGVVTCPHHAHRRQRRLLQPDFRASRVADHTDMMGREAEAVCRRWRAGDRVDVSAATMAVTTRAMNRVLFSDSLGSAAAAEVRECLAVIVRGLFVRTAVPVDALFRVPTPSNRRYRDAVGRVRAIVDEVVAQRRLGGPGGGRRDVLDTLLSAARGAASPVTGQEVRDQLVTLLLTGVESTALCLASALDLLARHPEAERRLHAEVDSVLAGRPTPGPDELARLTYTRCVVDETLRHRPPGWLFTRVTTEETTLAGHRLPKGATVLYSPYLLQHDPASFAEPERFLPERWLPGQAGAVRQGAMIPFATGSRKCLGDTFALAETTLALATIAGRWRLRHLPGHRERPRPAATLGPRSLVMTCEPRAQRPADAARGARSLTPRATAAARAQDSRTAGDNGVDDA
ncbi:cytochrome P450 [Streptomyces resistomycificus]|uniref:Cytochrome P450 n=2 Tax=Streptomyces resistomycificus TaxID=67356 RepID=A0A0L8L8X5_9ACTN|nr:cytochrome P450 [Streptomyces resistomycificus]KUO00784.1 cytochrome P450 [Streptomyces resistomycificus]